MDYHSVHHLVPNTLFFHIAVCVSMPLIKPSALRQIRSFIHVTPVADTHLSNASPSQTPLITPNQQTAYTTKVTTSKVMGACGMLLQPLLPLAAAQMPNTL
jgi:hypothetical protein